MQPIEIIVISVTALLVAGIIAGGIIKRRRAKKSGKHVSSCGCDCANCPYSCKSKAESK